MNIKEKLIRKLWNRIELVWLILVFVILFAVSARGDLYVYDLQATLTESNSFEIDNETFYYDMFNIYSDESATVTFNNYNADLGSNNPSYDFNDPYLYLYTIESTSFNGIQSFSSTYSLLDEDDDGNSNSPEGLYFYLDDIYFNNQLVAVISSYDPYVTGTVDFTVTSNQPLTVIPEPLAASLIGTAGLILLLTRKRGL